MKNGFATRAKSLPEVKVSTETVRRLRERYGKLLDAAPDAMIFVESNARIVMVNSQLQKLFGYTQEELTGGDLHMLIPERFHGRHRYDFSRFFAEYKARPMGTGLKIYGRKKDGTEFRGDISLSPLEDDGEKFVIAAIRDISDRVREHEQMEFNFQIQRAISSLLKIALEPVSVDEQLAHSLDIILSISNLALQSVGSIYLLDDASGTLTLRAQRGLSDMQLKTCSELPLKQSTRIEPYVGCEFAFTDCFNTPHEILQKEAEGRGVHHCIPISAGERVLGLINVFADEGHMHNPNETAFLNAVSNTLAVIVQRYQIDSERQKLREQLVQAEKFAALGRISANVAHELRNPLTVVGGFARRLMKLKEDESSRGEYIDFIVSEVSKLEEILEDILAYARTTTLQLKENYIHEIVEDVLKTYAPLCYERGITILKEYNYTSTIRVDKNRAREVIVNIVSNAIGAMGNNGKLSVSTAKESVDGVPYVTVKMSDTGEGIPPDKFDKIFEPFFTTRVSTKGIGLGLAISKKIMEDHGGSITVESTVGSGSTFTLHFPVTDLQP